MRGLLNYAMPTMGEEGGAGPGYAPNKRHPWIEDYAWNINEDESISPMGQHAGYNPNPWNYGNWINQTQWGVPGGEEYENVTGRMDNTFGWPSSGHDETMGQFRMGQDIANKAKSALLGPNQSFEGYGAVPGSKMINTGDQPFNVQDIVRQISEGEELYGQGFSRSEDDLGFMNWPSRVARHFLGGKSPNTPTVGSDW
tara:strand:+ start:219 stop:812 length:594 start_codon:yes stop_codon:yes gene_type:complete